MKKALIVDDSVFTLARHSELVALAGMEPLIAENGEVAIRLYKEHRPEIVLCDIMMPEMDGYEVVQALQTIDPKVFVYFISGEMTIAAQARCTSLGAKGFFQKPIGVEAVVSVRKHHDAEVSR